MNRLQLRDHFLKVLSTAQKKRPELSGRPLVNGEPAFVHFERYQMFNAVLKHRGESGLPPVLLSEIKRVESMATGHSDYSSKFALYCAELAEGQAVRF